MHAHEVPDEMPVPHFNSWNSRIRGFTVNLHYREALMACVQMRRAEMKPDCYSLAAVIKSCAALSDIELGKSCHGFAVKGGYWPTAPVEKALMDMYARFGMLQESHLIFRLMGWKDSASWNVLLSGYARLQFHVEAMGLLYSMHGCNEEEEKLNAITAAIILPICGRLGALKPGQTFHGYMVKIGLESDTLVGNSLVSMYAKCGSVTGDACGMFNLIGFKDVVSWNSMIAGYTENGFLAEAFGLVFQMVSTGMRMNYATVVNVLPICAFMERGWCRGKEIHCHVLRLALETDVSVYNALVIYYARVGDLMGAEHVFRHMDCLRDLVTWNTLIAGYAINGCHLRAMELFHELLSTGLEPDSITLISVLPVCAQLSCIQEGRKIHDYVKRHPELSRDTSTGNALVSFYRKCGEFDDALQTFMGISEKDLISWNSILAVFVDSGRVEHLCGLLNQMITEGIRPDSVTIFSVLQACAFLGIRRVGETHGYSIRSGLTGIPTVGNAILDAYAKYGNMKAAMKAFESFSGRNVVSSNTMISGYAKHGSREDAEIIFEQMLERDLATWNLMVQIYSENDSTDQAISLFREMQYQGMRPDTVSIMSFLPVCVRLASVHLARQCHGYTLRALLLINDLRLEGAFLDTYSKCGSISDAYSLFRTSSLKDLFTFTAMIGGYAMNGMGREALEVFSQMLELSIKPDHVVMTALLSACSHAGLVDEGWKHFNSIDEIHSIKPRMEHYACVVDLLARGGRLREAYKFITDMPCEADANVWGTLLGACKIHGEAKIGRLAADRLFSINAEAENIGNYVVMSNIFAAEQRWDGVEKMRRLMKTRDLRKPAGCSWIEVEKKRHVFLAGDLSHPHRLIIYCILETLYQQIKEPLLCAS